MNEEFQIIVDSREQRPYRYSNAITGTLKTGDYSIVGLEDKVTVERKSKDDAYGSLGAGRKRFEREAQRLKGFNYAAIVVEASLIDFLKPPDYTKMSPKAAINTLISWSIKYQTHVYFACDRKHGRGIVYHILEKYWRQFKKGGAA